jgi:hypothetical protein
MEILKFEEAPKRSSRKRSSSSSRKTILGIAAAAAIAVVGSTLAANISINSGASLEFGQGLTQTAACSGSNTITMTPTSTFVNSSGSGTFYLSQVSFGGSGLDTCNGKTFTIKAFDASTSTPLTIATANGAGVSQATFQYSTTSNGINKWSAGVTAGGGAASSATATLAFNLNGGTNIATSGAIYKLTIESN